MGMARKMRRKAFRQADVADAAARVVNEERDKAVKQACAMAGDYYSTLMSLALHDVCGFGPVRIKRVWEKMESIAHCITTGNVDYGELKAFVENGFRHEV